MKQRLLLCLPLLLAACTGTESGNPPLRGFDQTGCKSKSSIDKAVPEDVSDASVGLNNSLYDGLACFVWTRIDAHTLRIDFTNYDEACGSDQSWTPKVAKSGNEVQLVLDDTKCQRAGCDVPDGCHFDLSFTIELEDFSQDLPVRLMHRGCGYAPNERSAMLEVSKKKSDAVCTYGSYAVTGTSDRLRRPCDVPLDNVDTHCPEPLTCSDVKQPTSICLPSCMTDADCDALDRCTDAVCQLREVGVTVTRM